jgi:hypothetical protein
MTVIARLDRANQYSSALMTDRGTPRYGHPIKSGGDGFTTEWRSTGLRAARDACIARS